MDLSNKIPETTTLLNKLDPIKEKIAGIFDSVHHITLTWIYSEYQIIIDLSILSIIIIMVVLVLLKLYIKIQKKETLHYLYRAIKSIFVAVSITAILLTTTKLYITNKTCGEIISAINQNKYEFDKENKTITIKESNNSNLDISQKKTIKLNKIQTNIVYNIINKKDEN